MMGNDNQHVLIASDAGYGFVATLADLQSKNKAGKALLTIPKGGLVIAPQVIESVEDSQLIAIANDGRMLVFPVSELPVMARGKGNKIMGITPAKLATREEYIAALAVINTRQTIRLYAGRRHIQFKLKDLDHYVGERGRRGHKLPRGFQKVDRVEVE